MGKRWVGVALGLGLLAMTSPVWPIEPRGGEGLACDPEAKVANVSFTLQDMNGRGVRLSDYRGKGLLVGFWAPRRARRGRGRTARCGACRRRFSSGAMAGSAANTPVSPPRRSSSGRSRRSCSMILTVAGSTLGADRGTHHAEGVYTRSVGLRMSHHVS